MPAATVPRPEPGGPGLRTVLVVLGLMVAEAVLLLSLVRLGGARHSDGPLGREYTELDLGVFSRELASPDALGLVQDVFQVRVVLTLNPDHPKLGDLRGSLEGRRNLLKHLVSTEVLYRKSEADLRRPDVLDGLMREIKERLNSELGGGKGGQEVFSKVLLLESRLPSRR